MATSARIAHAAGDVEQQERDRAQPVLDVVAEDPEEQHVAEQVQPAAVEEHAGEHPEHRVAGEVAGPERVVDVGGDGGPLLEEPLERRCRRRWPQIDSSIANAAKHAPMSAKVTTGVRRAGFLSRSGITRRRRARDRPSRRLPRGRPGRQPDLEVRAVEPGLGDPHDGVGFVSNPGSM